MSFVIDPKWTRGPIPGAPALWRERPDASRDTRGIARLGAMGCLLLCIASGCIAPPAVLPSTCGDGFVNESAGEECDDEGTSANCDSDCTLPVCGDGVVNAKAGEQCDTEGSSVSCDDDCTVAFCGDGTVNPMAGELCDDGNDVSGDGCNTDCHRYGICGDGMRDTGEACDDGDTAGGDGCSADCRLESCGNGTLEPGETCDDDGASTATCDDDCTPVTCGDGTINPIAGEQCDEAGMSATCDHDCTPRACGDGVANAVAGEECDTGGNSATCDDDCTIPRCGDGVINPAADETCDASGVDTMSCDRDCTAVACGDSFVNAAAGEQCDTAGQSALCDTDCTAAWCGDGVINPAADETCDASGLDTMSCDRDCTAPECGDGSVNPVAGEQCDTAGVSALCDADCTPVACGDGTINTAAGETCDASGEDTMSCDRDCTAAECGDGTVNAAAGEQCDTADESALCDADCTPVTCGDGTINTAAGEACDASGLDTVSCDRDCTAPECGDGFVNPAAGEQCDTAGQSALCDTDCTAASCGDGEVNTAAGETCDTSGVDTMSCDRDCTAPECGDGFVNAAAGEQCDTAGESALCDADCTAAWCGDGEVNATAGEECDDGNELDGDGCSSACLLADPGTTLWSHRFGATGDDIGYDIAVDSAGNVLLTGYFQGTVDFGGGPLSSAGSWDVFAVKLDAQGQHMWSRRFGGTSDDHGRAIAVDSAGNVLLTGYFWGTVDFGGGPLSSAGWDTFAVKLDAQGQHLWSRRLGGTGVDIGDDIAVDSAGNVLLTGYFQGTADFGGGPRSSAGGYDIFAVELDAQGQHIWSRRLGGTSHDYGLDIAVDSAGNVLLTGYFEGTADFGGGPLPSAGGRDIFAVELDAQGQHLWSRRLGGTSNDFGYGITVDNAGNVLLTGYFGGTVDFGGGPLSSAGGGDIFAIELDAQGQHLWSRRFGGTSEDYGFGIAVDSAGNVLLTGYFVGTVDFGGGPLSSAGFDIFAVELDAQGQHRWSRRLGGTNTDYGLSIAVDSAGNVLLTGYFYGTADFGGGPLSSAGAEDIFAVKLSP
jgi:cysteine-rich repeat protein